MGKNLEQDSWLRKRRSLMGEGGYIGTVIFTRGVQGSSNVRGYYALRLIETLFGLRSAASVHWLVIANMDAPSSVKGSQP